MWRVLCLAIAALVFSQPAIADQKNWDRCLDSALAWEGGWTGPRKQEPGGYAMRGVSFLKYQEWRKNHNQPPPTPDELKNMSLDETKQIYKQAYGDPIGFDKLPSGYDCAMLHGAIMFGVGQGDDGAHPGMARLDAIAEGDYGKLIILMMRAKMYRPDCGPTKNEQTGKAMWLCKGWADRFVAVYDIAKDLAK